MSHRKFMATTWELHVGVMAVGIYRVDLPPGGETVWRFLPNHGIGAFGASVAPSTHPDVRTQKYHRIDAISGSMATCVAISPLMEYLSPFASLKLKNRLIW
jgi:hypothetical protein